MEPKDDQSQTASQELSCGPLMTSLLRFCPLYKSLSLSSRWWSAPNIFQFDTAWFESIFVQINS